MISLNVYAKAALIGIVAGMRSLSAPAITASKLSTRRRWESNKALDLIESPMARYSLSVLAAGELIGDKLPFTPPRTDLLPQAFRFFSGAICGAAIADDEGEEPLVGAIIGGIAAIGSCHAAYHIRKAIADGSGIPDAVTAVGEDALVFALGHIATTN